MLEIITIDYLRSQSSDHPTVMFHDIWQRVYEANGAVKRRDLSLNQLSPILPWTIVLDVDPTAKTYTYRVTGTEVVELIGKEPTGKRLTEILDKNSYAERFNLYNQAISEMKSIIYSATVPVEYKSFIDVYSGVFPVYQNDKVQLFLVTKPKR